MQAMPGTAMTYDGIADAAERADLIAYPGAGRPLGRARRGAARASGERFRAMAPPGCSAAPMGAGET